MRLRITNGTKVSVALGISVIFIIASGTFAILETQRSIEAARWIAHTEKVLVQTEQVLSLLKDVESGGRGFVITGKDAYLEPYNAAVKRVNSAVDELQASTSDNPRQQERINALRPLVAERVAAAERTIELRREGFNAALQFMLTDKGKDIMDQIRVVINAMEKEEQDLLQQRFEAAGAVASRSMIGLIATMLLGLIVIIVSIAMLHKFNTKRNEALALAQGAKNQAEEQVQARTHELQAAVDHLSHEVAEHKTTRAELAEINQQLEHHVKERTRALEEANRELETFTYTLAHDLRTPLRHISSFADAMLKLGELTHPAEQHYLAEILKATDRMREMIEGLIDYSRMGRMEMHTLQFNMREILKKVEKEIESERAGRNVDLKIGPMPQVTGDPVTLRTVFSNLLHNSMKYTRPKSNALIEVGADERPTEHVFWVRDNGVGFDPAYGHKLFNIFQRLHGSEFEGHGMGLASVRRIVERHGGRVWAEGKVDEGATVYFSLPKAAA